MKIEGCPRPESSVFWQFWLPKTAFFLAGPSCGHVQQTVQVKIQVSSLNTLHLQLTIYNRILQSINWLLVCLFCFGLAFVVALPSDEFNNSNYKFWTKHCIFCIQTVKNNSISWTLISQNFKQPGSLVLVCCFCKCANHRHLPISRRSLNQILKTPCQNFIPITSNV
jgi:hypothetical protein